MWAVKILLNTKSSAVLLFFSEDGWTAEAGGQLSFNQFNIDKILKYGASLLGSEGAEYDAEELGASFSGISIICVFL